MTGTRDARHRARETALKILYEWEVGGQGLDELLDAWRHTRPHLLSDGAEVVWPRLDEETWAFAEDLARTTASRLAEIDPLIEARAEHWRLGRMPIVDRLILRLAVAELLDAQAPPAPVIITEALELARTFSTEEAVKFVNGVLDAIARSLRDSSR